MMKTSQAMEKLTSKFKMDIEDIAFDMIQTGIYNIEDIKQYGFNTEEAEAIQREISKR